MNDETIKIIRRAADSLRKEIMSVKGPQLGALTDCLEDLNLALSHLEPTPTKDIQ